MSLRPARTRRGSLQMASYYYVTDPSLIVWITARTLTSRPMSDMQAGFSLFEAGSIRAKNVKDILSRVRGASLHTRDILSRRAGSASDPGPDGERPLDLHASHTSPVAELD